LRLTVVKRKYEYYRENIRTRLHYPDRNPALLSHGVETTPNQNTAGAQSHSINYILSAKAKFRCKKLPLSVSL
jgi:hypothetical protein